MANPRTIGDRVSLNRSMHGRLDHDSLHDMAVAKFGKGMSKLNMDQFRELHRDVVRKVPQCKPRAKSQKPKAKRKWIDDASAAQVWKINDERKNVVGMSNDATFNMWMARSLAVFKKAPEFKNLRNGEAYKVIEGLKALGARL